MWRACSYTLALKLRHWGNLGTAYLQSCFQIWFFLCVCRKARQLKKPHSLGYHGNIVDLWWVNCLSRIATFYDETYLCRFAAVWCHKKRSDDKMKKTYLTTLILYHVLSLGCLQYSWWCWRPAPELAFCNPLFPKLRQHIILILVSFSCMHCYQRASDNMVIFFH